MEQLIELLKQIQELAGVGIEALEASSGDSEAPKDEKPMEGQEALPEGEPPADGPPA